MKIDSRSIAELRKLCDAATPGPWHYNSYSKVFSSDAAMLDAENKLDDEYAAAGYPEVDAPTASGTRPTKEFHTRLYDADTSVAFVPAFAGDSAYGRHLNDAVFIAASRSALPAALDKIERMERLLREAADMIPEPETTNRELLDRIDKELSDETERVK